MSDRKPRKWEVSRMYGGWEAAHPSSERASFFRTFAEAIAYADRQARTVSIYVPPVGGYRGVSIPSGLPAEYFSEVFVMDGGVRFVYPAKSGGTVDAFIRTDECLPSPGCCSRITGSPRPMGDTDEAANRARKRDSWKYQLQIENDRVDAIRSEICVLEEELA